MIQEKDCFHFHQQTFDKNNLTDTKILNISLKKQNLLRRRAPNLIELNISIFNNLDLPCSILLNLETLSLKHISNLKFISKEENISLDKLKHLYLDNISFHEDNKIKISLNNLNYLDLRLKEKDRYNDLINIFDFKFLFLFKSDSDKSEEEEHEEKDTEREDQFDIFDKNYLSKYDYFNLEISKENFKINGSDDFIERLVYKYLFSKTKRNKYIFKTEYTNYSYANGDYGEGGNKEIRYCNDINYDDYYFINAEAEVGGYYFSDEMIEYETINSYSTITKYDTDSYKLIKSLENFEKNKNKLEILSIEDLDLTFVNSFMKHLKKFHNLKCFYITKDFKSKNNKQLIELLTILSGIKTLFKIDIKFQSELKLNNNEEKKIKEILPDVEIKKDKKESSIKWNNRNYEIIKPKFRK